MAAVTASAGTLRYRSFRLHPSLMTESWPPHLNFEVTNYCNLRCSHCGHSQYLEFVKGHAEGLLIDKLLPYLGQGRIPALGISGFGESLLSPQWASIMSRAKWMPDVRITFITNAVLLDRHLDKLDHPRLDIAISMDGASEDTYAHFRGRGYFERVVSNLAMLREKERAGALPRSNRTFIVVLSQINVHEMVAIVELAARLDVSTVIFSFQVFFDRERFRKESLFFSRSAYDHWLRLARERANDLGVAMLHPDSFDGKTQLISPNENHSWLWRDDQQRVRCGVIASTCYVTYHGQVEACCLPDRYIVGNLHEDEFSDVWYGHFYRRLRHSFLTRNWTAPCQNCNLFQAVDVHREQSHVLTPLRDDARLHPFPQPYRVTELDREYRESVNALVAGVQPESIMARLQRLLLRDGEFHEAMNALAIGWAAVGHRDMAVTTLQTALGVAPDDPIVRENLSRVRGEEAAPEP